MKSAYKNRRKNGADRYGQFRDGKQLSPDVIAGRTFYIPFLHLNK